MAGCSGVGNELSERNDSDGDIISMVDVLNADNDLEEEANAVLGDSDDKFCTFPQGYLGRQALYACDTCCPAGVAAICLACSYECHEGHSLYELYTKRNIRCDCGNSKFANLTCKLFPNKTDTNEKNTYNHNFKGLYCTCKRPYPDPDDDVVDEMIQCVLCEDWYHGRHLGIGPPEYMDYQEMVCTTCMDKHSFLWAYTINSIETKHIENQEEMEPVEIESKSPQPPETNSVKGETSSCKGDHPPPPKKSRQTDDTATMCISQQEQLSDPINTAITNVESESLNVCSGDVKSKTDDQAQITNDIKVGNNAQLEADDIVTPQADNSKADNNATTLADDIATPQADNSKADNNATTLADDIATPQADNSKADNNATTQADDIATPQADNSKADNATTPADDIATPQADNSKADNNATTQADDIATPQADENATTLADNNVTTQADTNSQADDNVKSQADNDANPPTDNDMKSEGHDDIKQETGNCKLEELMKRSFKTEQHATFWPSGWRSKLCTCPKCNEMYKVNHIEFLPDVSDTVLAYEERGKAKQNAGVTQYDRGIQALSSMHRTQQIEVISEYNDLQSELKDYLRKFSDEGKVVQEEDIREFFDGMRSRKRQRSNEGSVQTFCR